MAVALLRFWPGLAPRGKKRIVSGQFAERAAAGVHVGEQGIATIQKLTRTVMDAWIENEFAERTFLLFDGAHDVIETSCGGVELCVECVGSHQLAEGSLTLLHGSGDLIDAREDGC